MSKVRISPNEWYPVYVMSDDHGIEVEATDEQIERWRRATAEFEAAQDEMADLYGPAEDAERERLAREKAEREAAEKATREQARRAAEAAQRQREAKRQAMWQQIRESGGQVYDANGNRVGTVAPDGKVQP